jgi:hypothetical protein
VDILLNYAVVDPGFPPCQHTPSKKVTDRLTKLIKASSIVAPFDDSIVDGFADNTMPDLTQMFLNNIIRFLQAAPFNESHISSLNTLLSVMRKNAHLSAKTDLWNTFATLFDNLPVINTKVESNSSDTIDIVVTPPRNHKRVRLNEDASLPTNSDSD